MMRRMLSQQTADTSSLMEQVGKMSSKLIDRVLESEDQKELEQMSKKLSSAPFGADDEKDLEEDPELLEQQQLDADQAEAEQLVKNLPADVEPSDRRREGFGGRP